MSGTNQFYTKTGRALPLPPAHTPKRSSSILRLPTRRYDPAADATATDLNDAAHGSGRRPSYESPHGGEFSYLTEKQRRSSQLVVYGDRRYSVEGSNKAYGTLSTNISTRVSRRNSVPVDPSQQQQQRANRIIVDGGDDNDDTLTNATDMVNNYTASTRQSGRRRDSTPAQQQQQQGGGGDVNSPRPRSASGSKGAYTDSDSDGEDDEKDRSPAIKHLIGGGGVVGAADVSDDYVSSQPRRAPPKPHPKSGASSSVGGPATPGVSSQQRQQGPVVSAVGVLTPASIELSNEAAPRPTTPAATAAPQPRQVQPQQQQPHPFNSQCHPPQKQQQQEGVVASTPSTPGGASLDSRRRPPVQKKLQPEQQQQQQQDPSLNPHQYQQPQTPKQQHQQHQQQQPPQQQHKESGQILKQWRWPENAKAQQQQQQESAGSTPATSISSRPGAVPAAVAAFSNYTNSHSHSHSHNHNINQQQQNQKQQPSQGRDIDKPFPARLDTRKHRAPPAPGTYQPFTEEDLARSPGHRNNSSSINGNGTDEPPTPWYSRSPPRRATLSAGASPINGGGGSASAMMESITQKVRRLSASPERSPGRDEGNGNGGGDANGYDHPNQISSVGKLRKRGLSVAGAELLPAFPLLQGQDEPTADAEEQERCYATIVKFVERQPEPQRRELKQVYLDEYAGREEAFVAVLSEAYAEDFEAIKAATASSPRHVRGGGGGGGAAVRQLGFGGATPPQKQMQQQQQAPPRAASGSHRDEDDAAFDYDEGDDDEILAQQAINGNANENPIDDEDYYYGADEEDEGYDEEEDIDAEIQTPPVPNNM